MYESPADGSGQPFMMTIPQDYDRHHAMPVSLYMHGYSGNHSEHYTGSDTLRGMFELSVLGRGRGGSYLGLSEADVLGVLDYVDMYWNIDPDRVHILGGSMGGHGTFRMASRFPHRFASARPTSGYASGKPFGNLITLPIYAIHSDDDLSVPILHARGPLERLQELGGQVICDWTTGYGHEAWNYTQGNSRADKWFRQQVRPSSKSIRHLNYTAFDGVAKRSWWAEIEEWGNEPKPAKFVLEAGHSNMLYAQLTNIRQLKLSLAESPFIASQPLRVSVNGAPPVEKDNPLPDVVYLSRENGVWQLKDHTDESDVRRHTPGGPNLLYNGDPLLIVYGTSGSQEENEAMLTAAQVACQSSNAHWQKPVYDMASDGICNNQNLYGNLVIKADTDVGKDDIERAHLVLIGTERQNSIVASIAERLPVSLSETQIVFSDGETYAAQGLGLGLVHYNPDAPQKLIFWVASNDHRLYGADSPVPRQMAFQSLDFCDSSTMHDCIISHVDQPKLVAARSFDSHWNWNPRQGQGERIASSIKTLQDYITEINKAVKGETAADFAFMPQPQDVTGDGIPFQPGVTQVDDYVSRFYYEPIGIMTITGSELLDMQARLEEEKQSLFPAPEAESMGLNDMYRLAVSQRDLWLLVEMAHHIPSHYRLSDIQFGSALQRFLPRE